MRAYNRSSKPKHCTKGKYKDDFFEIRYCKKVSITKRRFWSFGLYTRVLERYRWSAVVI